MKRILKSEDVIWSPIWGMKGIVDVSCEVQIANKQFQIPIEMKTGSEDPVSHNAQVLLYSIILSQRQHDQDFILFQPHDLSGFLVYLKSNPLPGFANTSLSSSPSSFSSSQDSQRIYDEIKKSY